MESQHGDVTGHPPALACPQAVPSMARVLVLPPQAQPAAALLLSDWEGTTLGPGQVPMASLPALSHVLGTLSHVLGTAALSPPAIQSRGSPSATALGVRSWPCVVLQDPSPGWMWCSALAAHQCLHQPAAGAARGAGVRSALEQWRCPRGGDCMAPPTHHCLSFPRRPAWPGACLGQEWGQSEGWEEAVALTRSTHPPQPGCTQPSISRVTRSGALIPAGRRPEGCSREFLPVQAAAAPASREQEASHSHSSSGDDVRPGHKEGG